MWLIYLSLLLIFGFHSTFGRQKTPKSTSSTDPTTFTTQKPNQSNCRCVAIESCPSDIELDLRIVNEGSAAPCPTGQTWCCQPITPSLPCGTSRITNAPEQPNGTARYGAYPWQVAIMSANNTYLGSGVLINANHVLTVAHKVQTDQNVDFKIRLGDWDIKSTNEQFPHQEYNIKSTKQIFVHPKYNNKSMFNDIAIVRLNTSVPLETNLNINTACLPDKSPAAGSRCYVAGWGKNAFGPSGMYQNILRDVDVPIVDQTTCETRLRATRLGGHFVLNKDSFMCAGGEPGKDACTGDGGAPLMCPYKKDGQEIWNAVGLVTWGIGCADSSIPGVYINIYNYKKWINEILMSK
ncbi:hypothetical protein PV328_007576 [Microctonus aethiopoides]|uniref:Peptidase S1 domain-containing protein n=1 Tax=Microctonus aethiopoides TaxID=144406 RepID=A0AA39EZM7_9HYME|nr:hypothetical protein PV328_007576 [Microctonus aethiopoides]